MSSSLSDFRYQCAPCVAGRVRARVLGGRLGDVAPAAPGGEPVERVGVLVRVDVQRDNVIALEPAGPPAIDAAKAVASEYRAPHPRPPMAVKYRMISRATIRHQPTIAERIRRRATGGERTNEPAASTSAAATSSRPVLFVPRFASRTDP